MTLEELLDRLRGMEPREGEGESMQLELQLEEIVPAQLAARLAKLSRLGLLNGDVLMSIVTQAPIDPIGLAEMLVRATPGWTFNSQDCSVVRVLARDENKNVTAFVRVDLIDDTIETMAMNRTRQLVPFQRFLTMQECERRPPGPWLLEHAQKLCDDAVAAVGREIAVS